jgi:hypothetical protein
MTSESVVVDSCAILNKTDELDLGAASASSSRNNSSNKDSSLNSANEENNVNNSTPQHTMNNSLAESLSESENNQKQQLLEEEEEKEEEGESNQDYELDEKSSSSGHHHHSAANDLKHKFIHTNKLLQQQHQQNPHEILKKLEAIKELKCIPHPENKKKKYSLKSNIFFVVENQKGTRQSTCSK